MTSPNTGRLRIFVVDDETVIASTLATILQQSGFDAVAFSQPMEALKASRLNAPDLLISDVIMPLLNGVDLAILVVKDCPGCKVLLFSGQASTVNLLEEARVAGHQFEILDKPIHPADFLLKIRRVTAGAR